MPRPGCIGLMRYAACRVEVSPRPGRHCCPPQNGLGMNRSCHIIWRVTRPNSGARRRPGTGSRRRSKLREMRRQLKRWHWPTPTSNHCGRAWRDFSFLKKIPGIRLCIRLFPWMLPIWNRFVLALILLGAFAPSGWSRPPELRKTAKTMSYEKNIQPLLQEYCFSCHGNGKKKGDLSLDVYQDAEAAVADRKTWEKVLQNLGSQTMPPEHKRQPSLAERDAIIAWVQKEVFKCDCSKPDPGRVTIRRLNRTEYNNTIHDLVGVNFQPAEDFPQDDTGYGFDTIGDVLSPSPVLLEKYMGAAQRIMDLAIITDFSPRSPTNRFDAMKLDGSAPSGDNGEGMRVLQREGDVHVVFNFPKAGEYHLRVRAYGEQAGPDVTRMAFLFDNKELKRMKVPEVKENPKVYEMTIEATEGKHEFGASYLNNYVNKDNPDKKLRGDRNLVIDYLEIVSPRSDQPPEPPETHKRIFFVKPAPGKEVEAARQIISRFARKAW